MNNFDIGIINEINKEAAPGAGILGRGANSALATIKALATKAAMAKDGVMAKVDAKVLGKMYKNMSPDNAFHLANRPSWIPIPGTAAEKIKIALNPFV